MKLQIRPLSPGRAADFFRFFDHIAFSDHPEWGCGCYCCYFHASDPDAWEKRTPAENHDEALAMIRAGAMRGLLAYDRQKPIGWCHYDLLKNLPGAKLFHAELAANDPENAAIVCFTVAQGWRGQGVATKLLEAALADLAAQGVRRVEAYPVTADDSQEHNYPGPLTLYLSLGFTAVREANGHTLVEKLL